MGTSLVVFFTPNPEAKRTGRKFFPAIFQESPPIRFFPTAIRFKPMIQALYNGVQPTSQGAGLKPLEAMIASRMLDGDLKPGDPMADPDELAQSLNIPLSEVLDSISWLLSRRILRQDNQGNLFIHSVARLSVEMRQQAFVLKARQLLDVARRWDLPSSAIDALIFCAKQQVA